MSSTAPTSPVTPTPSFFTVRLEFVGKFTALFIGVVYAFGFLIIAIHHAQFSIPEFDPLKPKIFSTGLIFLLFVGIPMLGAFRTFGLFGLRSSSGIGIGAKPENAGTHKLMLVFGFYYGAYVMANAAGSAFFGGFTEPKRWGLTWFSICFVAVVILLFLMKAYFDRLPKTFALAVLVSDVALVAVAFRFEDRRLLWLSVWFYLVGLCSLLFSQILRDPNVRSRIEWERIVPSLATVLLIYATLIYKHIKPYFGGGVPIPSTMYFSSKVPFTIADSAEIQLLEETSDGYYVLASGDEKHAYFVRHDRVSAVHFGVPESKLK